ncbi:hypothetical protein EDB19DRAFT_989780 [Suillus lakei]|nr:hypothetical protein EDB19DRAFT_989780 [Suillus lakei]
MPPAKRMRTEAVRKERLPDAAIELSTTRQKNSTLDLPTSCFHNNTWHGVFMPTIAYAAGGEHIDPWLIDNDTLLPILVKVWKVVYAGNHSLVPYADAIYRVSKQGLNEWRGGFASAAIMMTTSVMASDPTSFSTYEQRSEFANFYFYCNRFIFKNDSSEDLLPLFYVKHSCCLGVDRDVAIGVHTRQSCSSLLRVLTGTRPRV